MRSARSVATAPQKGRKATVETKVGHVSNGEASEVEASSSSGSRAEPQHSDSATDNESVAEENEDGVEEIGEEEEEDEVVKKKPSAKRRKIEEAEEDEEEQEAKCLFPMNRIKMIAKNEGGNDMRLSHEAIFLLNKASEKFLELMCEEAYAETVGESKSCIAYHHLSSSVSKEQRLFFLSDLIPEKITAEEALKQRQLASGNPDPPPTN